MVDKRKTSDAESANAGLLDSELAQAVKESAQQIWLAGMGAFAKAQAEGGKVFETLVKEGAGLQRKTQAAAEERFGDVAGRMSAMAEDVSAKAGQQWGKLESIFEQRVDKALDRLGVPSGEDLRSLAARIDELAAQVAALEKAVKRSKPGAKTAKTSSRPGARKTLASAAGKAAGPRRTPRKTGPAGA